MCRDQSKPWFAPKHYGYGAGLPVAWQGCAVLAAYLAINLGAAYGLRRLISDIDIFVSVMVGIAVVSTIILIFVCAATTKGGWHWRWGGKS